MAKLVHEVAELDGDGLIIGVRVVDKTDWVTDAGKRQVKLPIGHDMRHRLRTMKYDFLRGAFFPHFPNFAPGTL